MRLCVGSSAVEKEKENHGLMSFLNIHEQFLNKYWQTESNTKLKGFYTMTKWYLFKECKGCSTYEI
jgi:hypothetical protein